MIGAGATLVADGVVTNTGTIALDGAGSGAAAWLFEGFTTLTGGGVVQLNGDGHDALGATRHKYTIVYNVDNTIVGSGRVGAHSLALRNDEGGTIDANGSKPLTFLGGASNSGLIEATGKGGLDFNSPALVNSATGVVLAGDGSIVRFEPSTRFEGGTLESVGSGKVEIYDGYISGLPKGDLTIKANVNIIGDCLCLETIVNDGDITVTNVGGLQTLGALTFEGDGVIGFAGGGIGTNAPLTLASGTIEGFGIIVGGAPVTVGKTGVIDGDGATSLVINEYESLTTNAGTIESMGLGGVVVDYSIANSGTLAVGGGGTFEVKGDVSGTGSAMIGGGTLEFLSSFDEAVTFTGGGTLALAQSQGFTNTVKGFSNAGSTTLDLGDIAFADPGEATFSGTGSGGVLTVTDGTHTATISLQGNYLGSTFLASSDGDGGTDVIAQKAMSPATITHAFVTAMAAFVMPAAGATHVGETWVTRTPMLARAHQSLS